MARDEWGFRTPTRKRSGGRPLSVSTIYHMLENPFYAGTIVWNGECHAGKHEPLVSHEEFVRVQALLGRPGRPRPQKHSFPFTGMIRCGACGLMVTAENKVNRYGYRYTYYHCGKRRLGPRCPERSIEAKELERQICRFLRDLILPSGFEEWMRGEAAAIEKAWTAGRAALRQSLQHSLAAAKRELAELTSIRLRALITDEEFMDQRQRLQADEARLARELEGAEARQDCFEPLSHLISFSNRAAAWFSAGCPPTKRLILETACSSLFLTDKIVRFEARKPFLDLRNMTKIPNQLAVGDDVRTFSKREDIVDLVYNIKKLRTMCETGALDEAA